MADGRKKQVKVNILWWGAAILLFLLFALWVLREPTQHEDYRIVFLGDSIPATGRGVDSVADQVNAVTGEAVFNGALGGTSMSRQVGGGNMETAQGQRDSQKDSLSLTALAEAIAGKDFGVQNTLHIYESGTEHFPETIAELGRIDFSQVDILFVGYGMNDYNNGTVVTNPQDPLDRYTFTGALRRSMMLLKERYPTLRMILLTPTYSWYLAAGLTCEEADFGGGTLADYVAAEKAVAAELGIELIDWYGSSYEHQVWEDHLRYTTDGMHPNEAGRKLLAQSILEYLGE